MPIQSPTLHESPANLLASRPTGFASLRSSRTNGKADLFASILGAQNPRTSLAESAHEAQSSRDAAPPVASRRQEQRDRSEEANEAQPSDDAEASRDVDEREAPVDEAGSQPVQVETSVEPAVSVETLPVVDAQVAPIEVQSQPTNDTHANEKPATPAKASTQPHTDPVIAQPATAPLDEQREGEPAANKVNQPELAVRKPIVNREQPREQQKEAPRETEQREAQPKAAKPQAATGATNVQSEVDAEDLSREPVKRATHDAFRQSAGQAQPREEFSERKTARATSQPSTERVDRPVATHQQAAQRESDTNKATREAIDKLLNEQAPRNSEPLNTDNASANRAEAPSVPNSSAPAAPRSQPAAISTTIDAATGSTTAPVTTAAAPTAPTLSGATTLAGDTAQTTNAQGSSATTDWMTRSDHAAGRILRGLSTMINQHGGTMTMRLDPPELGSLRIQMTIQNGSVSAAFTPSSAAARGLLEQNMAQLKTALESQGLMVDKLAIHTTSSGQTNTQAGQQHGTDGRGANEQQSQYADAGQGESRGRSDREAQQHAHAAPDSFDLSALFDNDTEVNFAQHVTHRADERIPA